jgi:hypothetical protein
MKIRDILDILEDGPIQTATVDKAQGNSLSVKDAAGNIINTSPDQIKMGPDGKPTITVPKVTPGQQINIQTATSEEQGDGAPEQTIIVNHKQIDPSSIEVDYDRNDHKMVWINDAKFADGSDLSMDELDELKHNEHALALASEQVLDQMIDAGDQYRDAIAHGDFQEEGHKDTIAQGGGNVGGDATDRFIDQVKDKGFERANRGQDQNAVSPVGGRKLREDDELMKWLTIAGIK